MGGFIESGTDVPQQAMDYRISAIEVTGCDQVRVSRIVLSCFLAAVGLAGSGRAQNVRLETGGGVPLQTESLKVTIPPLKVAPVLVFDFAFATDEKPGPGVLLDSLTFSLQTVDQTKFALLMTVDATGVVLAPATPGALLVDRNALKAASIAYFGSLSDPAQRSAFHVSYDLPADFASSDAQLLMDLFDNADGQKSVGTLANLAIVTVPEPAITVLAAIGIVLLWGRRVW